METLKTEGNSTQKPAKVGEWNHCRFIGDRLLLSIEPDWEPQILQSRLAQQEALFGEVTRGFDLAPLAVPNQLDALTRYLVHDALRKAVYVWRNDDGKMTFGSVEMKRAFVPGDLLPPLPPNQTPYFIAAIEATPAGILRFYVGHREYSLQYGTITLTKPVELMIQVRAVANDLYLICDFEQSRLSRRYDRIAAKKVYLQATLYRGVHKSSALIDHLQSKKVEFHHLSGAEHDMEHNYTPLKPSRLSAIHDDMEPRRYLRW